MGVGRRVFRSATPTITSSSVAASNLNLPKMRLVKLVVEEAYRFSGQPLGYFHLEVILCCALPTAR